MLGYRTPTPSVPSTFYDGKGFLPSTGNVEFPKSGPRRDGLIVSDECSSVNNWGAFIPPLKGGGFRLISCKLGRRIDCVGAWKQKSNLREESD